ncbi:hypothetical protein SRHO_G00250270 [Serrasalmus rhombeus]
MSDYGDLICFEELNRADQDEMVVVVYECVDAVRGRDPNSETEDTNTKRILQTAPPEMEEEIQQLRDLVLQLKADNERLLQERAAVSIGSGVATPASPVVASNAPC